MSIFVSIFVVESLSGRLLPRVTGLNVVALIRQSCWWFGKSLPEVSSNKILSLISTKKLGKVNQRHNSINRYVFKITFSVHERSSNLRQFCCSRYSLLENFWSASTMAVHATVRSGWYCKTSRQLTSTDGYSRLVWSCPL